MLYVSQNPLFLTIKALQNLIFPFSFKISTSKLYGHYKKEKNNKFKQVFYEHVVKRIEILGYVYWLLPL